MAASRDTISQVFFVWLLIFLIPTFGLVSCIAGSTEVLVGVFAGEFSLPEFLGGFLVPATLGNAVGGLVLVTLLNYGQVAASEGGARGLKSRESSRQIAKRNSLLYR